MAPSLVPVDRAGLPSGGRAGAAVRYGRVYLWTVDPSHPLGGRVTAMVVPLLRLDPESQAGYVEATPVGEVNTYFHLDRIAVYVDDLLRELGAPPLPRVTAVVAAHTAVAEAEDGIRDGVRRRDRWVPFQGGHYR